MCGESIPLITAPTTTLCAPPTHHHPTITTPPHPHHTTTTPPHQHHHTTTPTPGTPPHHHTAHPRHTTTLPPVTPSGVSSEVHIRGFWVHVTTPPYHHTTPPRHHTATAPHLHTRYTTASPHRALPSHRKMTTSITDMRVRWVCRHQIRGQSSQRSNSRI